MANQRYNRWQSLAITQLTVAVALVSSLSVAGLGAGLALLQNKEFTLTPPFKCRFALSLALLLSAIVFSCGAVITRLTDFRLTARTVRKKDDPKYPRSLTFLWLGEGTYGRLTWIFFWIAWVVFIVGIVLLALSVHSAFESKLH